MVKNVVVILALLFNYSAFSKGIVLDGTLDKFPIRFEFKSLDFQKGTFYGSYKLVGASKAPKRSVKGMIFGDCMMMDEFVKEKESGTIMLELYGQELKGWWIDLTFIPFTLQLTPDLVNKYKATFPKALVEKTNDELSGSYIYENYHLDDFSKSGSFKRIEMNCETGLVMVEEIDKDKIRFFARTVETSYDFELDSIAGIAHMVEDDKYEYYLPMSDDSCRYVFEFTGKRVRVSSTFSSACYNSDFSMVLYDLKKVSNRYDFDNPLSLREILEKGE